ncbi:MAG: sigma-70 family RNA polymerase sigma factor [Clostridia bacterium]|nr:sigma-70 family RNA polymerase sigma factor [Clostridia bacterium]
MYKNKDVENSLKSLDATSLIVFARGHDDAAFGELVERYTPMMNRIINSHLTSTADRSEAFSEACVALHRAVLTYNLEQTDVTFGLYAQICVRNQMLDLLRAKNAALDISDVDIESLAVTSSIESRLILEESIEQYKRCAKAALSDYEYQVFLLVLKGAKTSEIAKILCRSPKSVDNAKARMARILRAKLSGEGNR